MFDQNPDVPVQPAIPTSPPIKLWTPRVIAGIAFLLGFPAGIVLAAINWMRMGMKNKVVIFLAGGVVGIVILTIISIFLPGDSERILLILANIGIMIFLYYQVKSDVEAFEVSNNSVEQASELGGCLIGLATLALYITLIFGIGFFIGIVLTLLGIPIPN